MHLFVVNSQTLPVHLEFGFVGTGIRERQDRASDCSWSNVTLPGNAENTLAGLYADICRVHQGDDVLFYLEKPEDDPTREGGRFFGVFSVVSTAPFYEPSGSYLKEKLGLPLIYRLKVSPKKVFRQGLTEWQLLDEMTDFSRVTDIPWTLIYRKLSARRGCTPLLPHEASIIGRMLDLRNAGQSLSADSVGFDASNLQLTGAGNALNYRGSQETQCIRDRLVHLMSTDRKWERCLQAYLMQDIGRNPTLTRNLFPEVELEWIGNEVYVGAGLQQIDILIYSRNSLNRFIHIIELKSGAIDVDAAAQLNRYIKWVRAHVPDSSVHQIIPTVVGTNVKTEFHTELRMYLRGHGISHYRVVTVDRNGELTQDMLWF
ncbi:MAG: hypothetical protein AB1758_06790 [Candidatus Eremiobacterota bacterium]